MGRILQKLQTKLSFLKKPNLSKENLKSLKNFKNCSGITFCSFETKIGKNKNKTTLERVINFENQIILETH